MAVVEIAKIQIRRGDARTDGMPQLDTGELGWAVLGTSLTSTKPELYIGNKAGQDGALVSTNTRILTVLDLPNIFGSSITTSTYYYTGHRSVQIHTDVGGTDNVRTVKDKLDDSVSFFDFVTPADAQSDDFTEALQRAVNELFLNNDKAEYNSRDKLRIPAGFYNITDTVYLPPYASIVGEGKDKTVFVMNTGTKVLFQFVDLTSDPGSPVTLNDMVSQSSPRNILISGVTLRYADELDLGTVLPLLRADCAQDTIIDDVKFVGNSPYSSSNSSNAGIEIRGLGGITSRNLRITNCIFDTLRYGIKSDYDIEDPVIDNNRFQNLYRAISFGENLQAGNATGPVRARINKNIFNTIAKEAVVVAGSTSIVTNHVLSQNIYLNVGNDSTFGSPGAGDIGGQSTSTVHFYTSGNVSENDVFQRFTEINSTATNANFIIPIAGHASIVDNKVRSVAVSSDSGTLVKLSHTKTVTNIKIQYHINAGGITRWGNLYVVCSSSSIVDVTDDYKFAGSGDGGIIFDAQYSGTYNTITVSYSGNTLTGNLTYQINQYY